MRILLVEPEYYTQYPPLGLMKLASYHRSMGNEVMLVRGQKDVKEYNPDIIHITSLFTYAWLPVHKAIEYYHNLIPDAKIDLGGIYASIMPGRVRTYFPFINVNVGLCEPAEQYLPAYDLLKDVDKWKNWDSSILFTSRGCLRNCPFCIVPKIEGKIRSVAENVQDYIYPGHKKVILWDNNFLASPKWKIAINNLKEVGLKIDFNQGLDARLINDENASLIADLKMPMIRLAYDWANEKGPITHAVDLLSKYGVKRRNILFYMLYNFYDEKHKYGDTPIEFINKVKDIFELGCIVYPMRFEPLKALKKNQFVSPLWTNEELELIAKARRVIGYGGAFPPYTGLVNKINNAPNFNEAFKLYPEDHNKPKANSVSPTIDTSVKKLIV